MSYSHNQRTKGKYSNYIFGVTSNLVSFVQVIPCLVTFSQPLFPLYQANTSYFNGNPALTNI